MEIKTYPLPFVPSMGGQTVRVIEVVFLGRRNCEDTTPWNPHTTLCHKRTTINPLGGHHFTPLRAAKCESYVEDYPLSSSYVIYTT